MASGKANGVFAEGQYCAHVTGASLSPPEYAVLADALAGYMATVGVTPLPMTTRTLAMSGAWPLPDGDHPRRDRWGHGRDRLARDPIDGCWWIGNGIATAQPYAE